MALLTADWCPLGSSYFRKHEVYHMKWPQSDLSRFSVIIAPYAGPIALAGGKVEGDRTNFEISIYTAAGQFIQKIQWRSGEVLSMGWSVAEELVCVQKDGRVFLYDMFGQLLEDRRFSMGNEAQEMKVKGCKLFNSYNGTGVSVLTGANRFYLVNSVSEPKIWRMPEIPVKNAQPSCWAVCSGDRQTHIYCAVGMEIYHLQQGQQPEQIIPAFSTPVKEYADMCVSPDQSKIALISEIGFVQIASVDLKHSFCESDSRLRRKPSAFMWCGENAVACYHDGVLVLVGTDGDCMQYSLDLNVSLGQEPDGLRIVSAVSHEFLAEVPAVTRNIFSIGSMSPGALLLEALKEFHNESYKAFEYVQMLEKNVEKAVTECVQAAGHEYDTQQQKLLLEAASFGKAFVPEMNPDLYVDMCRLLRVLNAVRAFHIAIPLTFSQVEKLTAPVLVDRLLARRQWPLACKICHYLNFEPDEGINRVLAHWAVFKIRQDLSDEEITVAIRNKFGESPGVPYVDVAKKAADSGRKKLALALLECEPHVWRQISLFMRLGNNEKALQRAIQSGDHELIYFVILHLKDTLEKKGDLDFILRKFPAAFALYKQYCREESPDHLRALYEQEDDFTSQAAYWLQQASQTSVFEIKEKYDALKEAEKCFSSAKDDACASLTEEQIKLLKLQEELEEKLSQPLVELTLRETSMKLIEIRESSRADTLRKDFKVSDKQFWWWKVEALCRSGQWPELEQFAKSKKSPIGYVPFVEMCCKHGQLAEAKKYVQRVPAEDKVRAYLKMKLLNEAAELAFEQKNEDALNVVLSHCGPQSRGLTDKIAGFKQQLRETKR